MTRLVLGLAVVALVACGPRQRVRLRAPTQVNPSHVVLEARCTTVRVLTECPANGRDCTTRELEEPAPCPDDLVELDARDGRRATAQLTAGTLDVTLDGPPERPIDVAALSARRVRDYRRAMILGDLATVGGSVALIALAIDRDSDSLGAAGFFLGVLGYHFGAPIIHGTHGNPHGVALSLLRRVGSTLGVYMYLSATIECGDDNPRNCPDEILEPVPWIGAILLNVVIDAATAKLEIDVPIDVAPSVTVSADGPVVGVGGRF